MASSTVEGAINEKQTTNTYIHRKSGDEEGMKRIKDRPSRVDVESRKAKLLCEGAIWNLLGMCVNIFLLKTKTSQLKKKDT